jgi:hypothetical protein
MCLLKKIEMVAGRRTAAFGGKDGQSGGGSVRFLRSGGRGVLLSPHAEKQGSQDSSLQRTGRTFSKLFAYFSFNCYENSSC